MPEPVCYVYWLAYWPASASSAPLQAVGKLPKVVIIFIDDLGYGDLGCYGNTQASTPNIDRLASQGTRFTQFYANSPVCSPSRVAMLTGQYPAKLGVDSIFSTRETMQERGMPYFLPPATSNIARRFKQAGYSTGHFGKWHIGGGRNVGEAPLPTVYGFDQSLVSFEGLGDRLLNWESDARVLHEQSLVLGKGKITFVEKHKKTGIYVDSALAFIKKYRQVLFHKPLA